MRSFGRLIVGSRGPLASLRLVMAVSAVVLGISLAPTTLSAQESKPAEVDIITPHITDSYELEVPWFNSHFAKEICLGRHLEGGHCGPLWDPIGHIGPL